MPSVTLAELEQYCNTYLDASSFKDYCPNGLQVDAGQPVNKIVTGVTASQALIDAAVEQNADLLLVHHGYFWKGESPTLTGVKGNRIRALMQNGVSLMAYHLPLDAHPELGNNAMLAKLLGIECRGGLDDSPVPVGNWGVLDTVQPVSQFAETVASTLCRDPLVIGNLDRDIERIAWCTGAAQSYIEKAAALGVDCFVTGEVSEQTVHLAHEHEVVFIAAGHHATERYGVKALGEHLGEKFAVDVEFIDVPNPV